MMATPNSGGIAGTEREPYEPASGSWVAELEAAKSELAAATTATAPLRSGRNENSNNNNSNSNDYDSAVSAVEQVELLRIHLRICRAYSMLRQWERLLASSKKGWAVYKLYATALSRSYASAARRIEAGRVEASLRAYRKLARAELSVKSMLTAKGYEEETNESVVSGPTDGAMDGEPSSDACLDSTLHHIAIVDGRVPNRIRIGASFFANTNLFQAAVLGGDLRLVEFMAALGATLDFPFLQLRDLGSIPTGQLITVPLDASALVMSCLILAIADSTAYRWAYARSDVPHEPNVLDNIAECAMQLVRLGADVQRKLNLSDPPFEGEFRIPEIDGKTAFQIAAMSKRRALVALMLQHMQMSPEDRAEIVHCRCGSRLPWKMCHSTGAGQPPHYIIHQDEICYRFSPLARCPCDTSTTTYYKCCWKDNGAPSYLSESTGLPCRSSCDDTVRIKELLNWTHKREPTQAEYVEALLELKAQYLASTAEFVKSPAAFLDVCSSSGPKTKMTTWDWRVYVGCFERLQRSFPWSDVHWDLDRAELLKRTRNWNEALQKYCDDMGLQGEERERVVKKHTANPCAPCGFLGCDAFETKVREFERCAQCKAIAYCGRRCQGKDWAEHQKKCKWTVPIPRELR